MMDLLIQATTINKISPGGHIINVISKDERNVNYKPNTPIGSLDANTVYIIPKSTLELPVKRMPKLANQPFEQTFRLQVNLPHNQRMVLRVSPRTTLSELKGQICREKELERATHHLVHPAQPDTVLDLNATLEVYGCAEISLMSNSGLRDSIRNTSTNIFPTPKFEEEKKKSGILRLFSRKKRNFSIESSNGSLPTSHSDTTLNRNSYQPKQSLKRKPAPAPPPSFNSAPPLITQSTNSINSRPESEISVKTADEIESSVSHSRHSSDSSGYHEPSVFSDCSGENKSPEASIVHDRQSSPQFKDYPPENSLKRSSMTSRETNLTNVPSCSNVSISSASRKRKAPQPPQLPAIESPSSPDQPTPEDKNPMNGPTEESDTVSASGSEKGSEWSKRGSVQSERVSERSERGSELSERSSEHSRNSLERSTSDSVQQESEALQYLEDVLQESEKCSRNFSSHRVLDDSDTDSQKDEGEVISVCQAEVHANDQDSSDSIVEPPTVVNPDPALSNQTSFAQLSTPSSQPEVCEVVDPLCDDSGISHSLTSDADSSVPSINSEGLRPDSGCQEELIYCNVADSLDVKSVPSSGEFNTDANDAAKPGLENNSKGESSGTYSSTTNTTESSSTIPTLPTESVSIVSERQNSSTAELPLAREDTTPLPMQSNENDKSKCDISNSGRNSVTSSLSMDSAHNSTTHTPQLQKKLDNFALGCYRKDEDIDIYSVPLSEIKASNGVNPQNVRTEIKAPLRKSKMQPDVKISSFKERNQAKSGVSSENGQGKVLEKCAQLSNMGTLPLTGRSTSLFNLTPQKKFQRVVTDVEESEETVDGGMKRTYSDHNVAKDLESAELKETFLNEQRRLQEEYLRLQEQFISWQRQLLSNQSLLQNEKIVPQMPFPSLEGLTSLDNNIVPIAYGNSDKPKSDTSASYNDLKTRSLPRPKTKPLSLKEQTQPKSLIAQSPTELSIVEIDISTEEPAKRPETLTACSVDVQADFNQDKVTQVPSPQDKNTQVPSPQEKVTSSTQAPSPPNVLNKDTSAQTSENIQASDATDVSSDSLSSPENENSKSQTLPRPKPKSNSALEPSQTKTMTLNRNTRPKPQAVSVTIGSWQQRQTPISEIEPSSNVASRRSKFLSLENIPQSSMKNVASTMERRKLPPVPIESKSPEETEPKTLPKFVEAKTIPKTDTVRPKQTSTDVKVEHVDRKTTRTHSTTETKVLKTVPKQIDDVPQAKKSDIRLASREPTATFKLAKPFVKLSSMKDEPHQPSIIGLRKWPLAESESMQSSILDDLKASSKKPGGFVQEKIRRAEVDLRKPKSKPEQVQSAKPPLKQENPETSKLHITKLSINKSNLDTRTENTLVKKKTEPKVQVKNTSGSNPAVTSPTTGASKNNTVPKSQSLNTELMNVFSKKASRDVETKTSPQVVTVNGGVQQQNAAPPPPPPPPMPSSSTMPMIPPAEQIPNSSRLVMARSESKTLGRKEPKKSPTKFSQASDPREELMLEIRGFGGKQALRKAPSAQNWHLKVYGTATKANMSKPGLC
ncbi:hypothetical protein JTE90_014931 [Oedothorax gibbosus]|uniref:WH2 domain-containing protein n=1 Tax=Oedothorax gibbosus TaxID=931172 RepID=A0AAV6VLI4_9ARAC|nr:hypothetical protein JTE90_014931 [Oedothorax gibbosus]